LRAAETDGALAVGWDPVPAERKDVLELDRENGGRIVPEPTGVELPDVAGPEVYVEVETPLAVGPTVAVEFEPKNGGTGIDGCKLVVVREDTPGIGRPGAVALKCSVVLELGEVNSAEDECVTEADDGILYCVDDDV
jgi:hypothetical protein